METKKVPAESRGSQEKEKRRGLGGNGFRHYESVKKLLADLEK